MLAETAPRGRWRAAPGSQPCPSPLPWSRVSLGTAALVALAQIPMPLGFPGPRAHAFPGFPGLSASSATCVNWEPADTFCSDLLPRAGGAAR